MKVLVIGYGSMGRRRIRLIKEIIGNIEIICVDCNLARQEQAKKEGYSVFSDLDEAILEKPNIAFLCTSPGMHSTIILKLVANSIHTFTELNLLDTDYNEIIALANHNKVKVFMSSTMLYDRQILAIQREVKKSSLPMNYIYHVGQYLPDWHPWENYKDYFISNKKTNGCREILAIQLPWIIDTFGNISQICVQSKKSISLDIDFNDTYFIQIKHENGTFGTFICDVVSRKATTYLEIFAEDTHIVWNGTPDTLCFFNTETKKNELLESYLHVEHLEDYADNIIENEYSDEIKAFLDWINMDVKPKYTIEDDMYTLSLINEIEGV